MIFNIFSSTALFIFSHLEVRYFPFNNFFLKHFINNNKLCFSFAVPYFVFNFKSTRTNEDNLSLIFKKKLTSKVSKLKIFHI